MFTADRGAGCRQRLRIQLAKSREPEEALKVQNGTGALSTGGGGAESEEEMGGKHLCLLALPNEVSGSQTTLSVI